MTTCVFGSWPKSVVKRKKAPSLRIRSVSKPFSLLRVLGRRLGFNCLTSLGNWRMSVFVTASVKNIVFYEKN